MEAEDKPTGPSHRTKIIIAIVILAIVVMILVLVLNKNKSPFRNPKSIKDSNEEDMSLYPMVKKLLDKQENTLRNSIQ